MPQWIEVTRSPEYSPKLIGQELVFLQNDFQGLLSDLGDAAFMDKIEKAMLGETIIIGGYIRTELIAAQSITADKLDVQTLSAISANLGEVTSGIITGATIRTSASGDRIQLDSNMLRAYKSNVRRVQLDYDSVDFYTQSAKKMGEIFAVDVDMGDDVVPVLRISADTGAVELRSRRSASNFALLRLSADHPEYEWDGHMLTVMIESGSDYGALTVGAGGVRIEGSAVGALIDGNSTISGNFEPQGVNSFNLGSSSMYWKNVYAGDFVNRSERIAKENIRKLDTGAMYDKVKTIPPYSYQYKEDDAEHIGVIADESPREILDESGTGISLYAYTTMLLGALQETIKKVEKLEEDINGYRKQRV